MLLGWGAHSRVTWGLTSPGLHPPGLGTLNWSKWKTSLEYRQPVPQGSHSGHSLVWEEARERLREQLRPGTRELAVRTEV